MPSLTTQCLCDVLFEGNIRSIRQNREMGHWQYSISTVSESGLGISTTQDVSASAVAFRRHSPSPGCFEDTRPLASINDAEVLVINGHRYPHHERYTPRSVFCLPRILRFRALNKCRFCYNACFMHIHRMVPNPSLLRGLLEEIRVSKVAELRGSLLHT